MHNDFFVCHDHAQVDAQQDRYKQYIDIGWYWHQDPWITCTQIGIDLPKWLDYITTFAG
jgi:hypothetical protein